MLIAAYVSGHGFGHATRTCEVLREVRTSAEHTRLALVSSAPEELFRAGVPGPFEFRGVECDPGFVQRDALVLDAAATAERWRGFVAGWEAKVAAEAAWLREIGATLVLGDIPPLAFAAAAAAGLPSVGLANFSWDWIYRHAGRTCPALLEAASHSAAAYSRATLLLRLPFAGELSAFPRVEDIPLVARKPRVAKLEARRRLGLDERPAVLLSFGGIGLPGFRPRGLAAIRDLRFLVADDTPGLPPESQLVSRARLQALSLGYEDVVGAADVVVTKPGYGIVTDAIAAKSRLVYTERGDFPEYPILVAGMVRYLPALHVSNRELREGRIAKAVREVLALPWPAPPDLAGARAAARRILELGAASGGACR